MTDIDLVQLASFIERQGIFVHQSTPREKPYLRVSLGDDAEPHVMSTNVQIEPDGTMLTKMLPITLSGTFMRQAELIRGEIASLRQYAKKKAQP